MTDEYRNSHVKDLYELEVNCNICIEELADDITEDCKKFYQQGRADVLREHREQCNGKCFKCEVSVPFINSDGEEVILPYSYSYKTDCEDNRYINAKEVLSLIKQSRADVIEPLKQIITESEKMMWHSDKTLAKIKEQLKEQKE